MSNRIIRLTVAVISLLLISAYYSSPTKAQTRKPRFDPDGSFWIKGKAPDGFSDFGGINLNAKRVKRLPSAGVQLSNGRTLRFKQLRVTRERFTFTTAVVSNISYSFSGKFLKGGVYGAANLDDETPVLEGTLIKYRNGEKVTQAKLTFVYFGGT
ncbi:MAG TPA: hypothetical protein VLE19_02840 [Pyrinomonadaceae bacterium]|nr:hypothetical protein [Pyrinomonadaceae bacterium]